MIDRAPSRILPAATRSTALTLARTVLAAAVAAAILAAGYLALRPPQAAAILLTGATARPLADGTLAIYLTIGNAGGPDRLTGASSPDGGTLRLAGAAGESLAIPAASTPSLAADGAHLVLAGLPGEPSEGRLVPLTLAFETAGDAATRARIGTAADPHAGHALPAPQSDPPPRLALAVTPDGDGWRVEAAAANFRFDRDAADGPHVPGAGHGHLYLDGLKLQRLYQPTARIGALPPGEHEIRVTLNANDHRPYGTEATATITAR